MKGTSCLPIRASTTVGKHLLDKVSNRIWDEIQACSAAVVVDISQPPQILFQVFRGRVNPTAPVEITISAADNWWNLSDSTITPQSTAICGSSVELLQSTVPRSVTWLLVYGIWIGPGYLQRDRRSRMRWQACNAARVRRRWEVSVRCRPTTNIRMVCPPATACTSAWITSRDTRGIRIPTPGIWLLSSRRRINHDGPTRRCNALAPLTLRTQGPNTPERVARSPTIGSPHATV